MPAKNSPEIETEVGKYKCDRLVLTPGPWTSHILTGLSLPLRVTRQQKFYFQPHHTSPYEPDVLPVYADFDTQFYGFPYYGPGIKVADDTLGEYITPDMIDRSLDAHKQSQLQAWLEAIIPGANFSFGGGATCIYTVTPDLDFLIGAHPRNPNILVGSWLFRTRVQVFNTHWSDTCRAHNARHSHVPNQEVQTGPFP